MKFIPRWLRLGHPQRTLSDVWAANLSTELPAFGTISEITSANMLFQDFEEEINVSVLGAGSGGS